MATAQDEHRSLSARPHSAAFPFHFVLDRDLRITQAGTSIQRMHHDNMVGTPSVRCSTVATRRSRRGFEDVRRCPRSLFLLRSLNQTRPRASRSGVARPVGELLGVRRIPMGSHRLRRSLVGLTLSDSPPQKAWATTCCCSEPIVVADGGEGARRAAHHTAPGS